MRVSTHFLPYLAAALALTLVPVTIHSYAGIREHACADWPSVVVDAAASRIPARDDHIRDVFGEATWARSGIDAGPDVKMETTIVRSYDAKRVYHYPDLPLLYPGGRLDPAYLSQTPGPRTVRWVQDGAETVPIHEVIYTDAHAGTVTMGVYLLTYRSSAVGNPYLAQIGSFVPQLLRGRSPMTLYFVASYGPARETAHLEKVSTQWLLASWRQYAHLCRN